MKIHEYQAKAILARYGVPVPRGEVAFSAQEARRDRPAARRRRGRRQGADSRRRPRQGRRRQGGARSWTRRRASPRELLGKTLVTYQTGPGGQVVVAAAGRGRPGHRPRALPRAWSIDRSTQKAGADGQRRGRRGHRGGGGEDAREDPQGVHRSRRRACAVPGAQARLCARPDRRLRSTRRPR